MAGCVVISSQKQGYSVARQTVKAGYDTIKAPGLLQSKNYRVSVQRK